jgi:NAD(P)-dependent dehydrogenase (short-subunit alcohol dehydrogenase family)
MKLAGKCALVTGAGVGIGREIALELARQGADVVLSYFGSREGALSAVAEIEKLGRRATALAADVGYVAQCYELVNRAQAFLGRLDILVNNAGVTLAKDFFEVTQQDFDYLYGLNIRGQYFCAQQAARFMREQGGGVIINILSIHALAAYPRHSLYDGTKGAIAAWTRSLALELAPHRIRVVGVAPGAIEVPRYYASPTYNREALGRRIPWGRVGFPADIAKACAFLASDDAEFIVGAILVVDGGTTARMALDADDL